MKILYLFLILLSSWNKKVKSFETRANDGSCNTSQAAQALHDFSFEMFANISSQLGVEDSMVFSPISLYNVLSMLLIGLNGRSQEQLANLLHFDRSNLYFLNQDSCLLNQVFARNRDYDLHHANRIYVDSHFELNEIFKSNLMEYFHSPTKQLNFDKRPNKCRKRINLFVKRKTRGDISELLPEGSINRETVLLLVNALYMKTAWKYPFSYNEISTFQVSERTSITTPMMLNPHAKCFATKVDALDAMLLRMPFKGDGLDMFVFIPHEIGNFSRFEQAQSPGLVQAAIDSIHIGGVMRTVPCRVTFPKFSLDHRISNLKGLLRTMGVRSIFESGANDFSPMTPSDQLYVSDIDHQVVIKVNENGIKAAASTRATISQRMIPKTVVVDKPFIFFIRHRSTGALLFLGRMVRPLPSDGEAQS